MTNYQPTYVRTMHRYGFRSGEWAELFGTELVNNRLCFVVGFPDGVRDSWVIGDLPQYEFKLGKTNG